jgi:S1-C subfamily serine protease
LRLFRLVLAVASLALLVFSCASTVAQAPASETTMLAQEMPSPTPPPPVPEKVEEPALPQPCTMFVKTGVLRRAALVRLIEAGLPRWMQGVEGDRTLANHRFQGWLIKSLYPGDPCYHEIDLRPGDVVQKVNGKSIEKPDQAFDVVESLRTAPAIVVEFLRDGKPQRITLAIADE